MTNPKWEIGPVKLVNGCDATIHRFCEKRQRYIGEWIGKCGGFYAAEWRKGGSNTLLGIGDPMLDLAPPPKKTVLTKTVWMVVRDNGELELFYKQKTARDVFDGLKAFAIRKIEPFEVTEGEGL